MLALVGKISLWSALFFSLLQSSVPIYGYARGNPYAMAIARPTTLAAWFAVIFAFACLVYAFYSNDFSITYVALNSHPTLPLLYRLTAVWGAHEGSILLWVLILTSWSVVYSLLQKPNQTSALTLAILGVISLGFLSFSLFTSNPFLVTDQLFPAQDLNPLLQDPGFVIHPPMLYAGYVGFSVAFAMTLAALITGSLDQTWARTTRQFAVMAWCFLTLGIALGSWWAYRVLGWGGFWFWDPVENASLLPWLGGTALIHVLLLVEKRNHGTAFAALLAIICFTLSLLGTFLVRSGVLISVHAFANDPSRGLFLLMLLAVVMTITLGIYVLRFPLLKKTAAPFTFHWCSREMGLLLNGIILTLALATILLGTIYPLIVDALNLGLISVGAPYFNLVMTPILLILMILMIIGPLCRFHKESLLALWQQLWKKILLSIFITCGLWWSITGEFVFSLSLFLSILIISSALPAWKKLPGMTLAHSGFALLIIGIMLSSSLNQERDVSISEGQHVTVGPYQFLFVNSRGIQGANYRGIRATFAVTKANRPITLLYPEKRIYTVRDMVMTKVAIHPGIFRDLYLALGEPLSQDKWSVRIYYKPFIRFIWFGALLMMIGGLFVIFQRKEKQLT